MTHACRHIGQHLSHIRLGDVGNTCNGSPIFGTLGRAATSAAIQSCICERTRTKSNEHNKTGIRHHYKGVSHAYGFHLWTPHRSDKNQWKIWVGVDGFRIKCARLHELAQTMEFQQPVVANVHAIENHSTAIAFVIRCIFSMHPLLWWYYDDVHDGCVICRTCFGHQRQIHSRLNTLWFVYSMISFPNDHQR